MSEFNCKNCGRPPRYIDWYHLDYLNDRWHFCSRRCLAEFIAPELTKAVVVKQWVPNEEEVRRMSEEST